MQRGKKGELFKTQCKKFSVQSRIVTVASLCRVQMFLLTYLLTKTSEDDVAIVQSGHDKRQD